MELGLIHIYCGDGKGKTTAAVGLGVRCLGAGGKVLMFQFLKDGSSSEVQMLKKSGIDVLDGMKEIKFTFSMTAEEKKEAKVFYNNILDYIFKISPEYDMVILDEIMGAVSCGFISEEKILDFVKNKPENTELVMTGRNPSQSLIDLADYVSEVKKIKHPYDRGICARKAVEL